jgi:hypothetical protein
MRRELPLSIKLVCSAFVDGLYQILGEKLYGVYLYGATVFADGSVIQDIDLHVILRDRLTQRERGASVQLHAELAERFPPRGGDLDAYYILLEDAKGSTPPQHQINAKIWDDSWALHCAHVRAGYYLRLWGPEPTEIFPAPSWSAIAAALEDELLYVKENLHYRAYCILNLCRIMYSYAERDPAVSKRFSGGWVAERFPEWAPLIGVAIRFYAKENSPQDDKLMGEQLDGFVEFALDRISEFRGSATSAGAS